MRASLVIICSRSWKVEESAFKVLQEEGFSSSYGARPLQRVVQQRIANPLARMILQGEVPEEGTVSISGQDGEIALEAVPNDVEQLVECAF